MKLTERILLSIFILSIILGIFHLPGFAFLFILSGGSLAIIYLIFGFILFSNRGLRETFKSGENNTVNYSVLGYSVGVGAVLWISITGIFFQYFSFPGTAFFLGIGFLSSIVMAVVIKTKKANIALLRPMLSRLLIFGGICLFLLALPTKIWLNWRYSKHPAYVQAILEAREHPDNQALWDKVDEERKKLR